MNSTDIFTKAFCGICAAEDQIRTKKRRTVHVKALSERDRRRLLSHFLALSVDDRVLRFGAPLPDEAVADYVKKIDFERDMVFGVYDRAFRLVGAGHLAFMPRAAAGKIAQATGKAQIAEFGVSVLARARGLGIGSKLFERAAIHCRNADVDTLTMQCLSSNRTMIHIAKKAGMQIRYDFGEANAYLNLAPPDPASVMQEAMQEQVAVFDYALKANARMVSKWLGRLARLRKPS